MPTPRQGVPRKAWLSLEGWAVLAATIFVVMVVVGALPRIPW